MQLGALVILCLVVQATPFSDLSSLFTIGAIDPNVGALALAAIGTGIAVFGGFGLFDNKMAIAADVLGRVIPGKREAGSEEPSMDLAKRYFALAMKIEKESDCLTRVFCNVAANTESFSNSSFEHAVQLLGERLELHGEPVFEVGSLSEAIPVATLEGRKFHNNKACSLAYPKCTSKQSEATQRALHKYYKELL